MIGPVPPEVPKADPALDEALHAATMLRIAFFVGYVVCVVFAGIYYTLGDPNAAVGIVLAIVPIGIGHALYSRFDSIDAGREMLNVVAFVTLAWLAWRAGGLTAPQLPWLLAAPTASITMGRHRSALFWTSAASAVVVLLGVAEARSGALPAMLGDYPILLRVGVTLGLFGLILSFLFLVERAGSRARRAMAETAANLARVNVELAQARDEALEALATKSRFLANMSHEIRTPLNGMLGMTELLIETPLSAGQREWARTAYQSGRSLLGLLNDILDFSRNESGALHLERIDFDLRELVDGALALSERAAAKKALELRQDVAQAVPARLAGDPVRLRQILDNLVGNAVKFTAQGHVTVRVTLRPDAPATAPPAEADGAQDLWVRIEVEDSGIGIDSEALRRIFQPFAQADESTTRRFGGSGLGLAICSQLAHAMGGSISVESQPGTGSIFRCELPLAIAPDPPSTARPADAPGHHRTLAGLRVLVAEDNGVNQTIVSAMLDRLGAQATIVEDGVAAVDACATTPFDVVLMDCHMPRMDGIEATRRIRSADIRPLPAIVAVTADALAGDRERFLAAGMDDYLPKPFTIAQLTDLLERHRPGEHSAAAA